MIAALILQLLSCHDGVTLTTNLPSCILGWKLSSWVAVFEPYELNYDITHKNAYMYVYAHMILCS